MVKIMTKGYNVFTLFSIINTIKTYFQEVKFLGNSVVEVIQKEIEFQQEIINKKLISGIKGKQEWLINNGIDKSGAASGIIHETWASIVDPYINNLISFVTLLPNELNRDYSNEELDEIEKLLQSNYNGLLGIKSILYSPPLDLQRDEKRNQINNSSTNLRITIAADKIRLKAKHKKNSLSDEFIIRNFDLQVKENKKYNFQFWLTILLSFAAIIISIVTLVIDK